MPYPDRLHMAEPADYLIHLLGMIDAGWAAALGEMGIVTHERDADL